MLEIILHLSNCKVYSIYFIIVKKIYIKYFHRYEYTRRNLPRRLAHENFLLKHYIWRNGGKLILPVLCTEHQSSSQLDTCCLGTAWRLQLAIESTQMCSFFFFFLRFVPFSQTFQPTESPLRATSYFLHNKLIFVMYFRLPMDVCPVLFFLNSNGVVPSFTIVLSIS